MNIYIIEFWSDLHKQWVPGSHPYYKWEDANRALNHKPKQDRVKNRVAEYKRLEP